MTLPILKKKEETKSIIVSQKVISKGLMFSAMHKGNSTISLGERYGLKITRIDEKKVALDLVMYSIDAKSYTQVQFSYKKKAVKPKKVSKIKKKKSPGVVEL